MLRIQLLQRLDLGGELSRSGLRLEQITLHGLKSLPLLNKLFSDLLWGHLSDIIPAILITLLSLNCDLLELFRRLLLHLFIILLLILCLCFGHCADYFFDICTKFNFKFFK